MDISPEPGGVVQGGGQLPSVRGVGQGRAPGKPGQAHCCFVPDMLVVASEWMVDVEQEDKVLGLLQMGNLPTCWSSWEGSNCDWLWCKQTG